MTNPRHERAALSRRPGFSFICAPLSMGYTDDDRRPITIANTFSDLVPARAPR
jgi:hypothetical protein